MLLKESYHVENQCLDMVLLDEEDRLKIKEKTRLWAYTHWNRQKEHPTGEVVIVT